MKKLLLVMIVLGMVIFASSCAEEAAAGTSSDEAGSPQAADVFAALPGGAISLRTEGVTVVIPPVSGWHWFSRDLQAQAEEFEEWIRDPAGFVDAMIGEEIRLVGMQESSGLLVYMFASPEHRYLGLISDTAQLDERQLGALVRSEQMFYPSMKVSSGSFGNHVYIVSEEQDQESQTFYYEIYRPSALVTFKVVIKEEDRLAGTSISDFEKVLEEISFQ